MFVLLINSCGYWEKNYKQHCRFLCTFLYLKLFKEDARRRTNNLILTFKQVNLCMKILFTKINKKCLLIKNARNIFVI